ncbi:hypothetical protein H3V53_07340 [Paraburkholderia bengalensis]|uniref:FCD domain-containing protein n=1 Tax=Paraburkholderia bengalensis TaxID=2747562 RepID=A0ABU8IN42_9BURK
MTLLAEEESALALANRHMQEALQRIALQEKRVEGRQANGEDIDTRANFSKICRLDNQRMVRP